jgi:hypothetical protein
MEGGDNKEQQQQQTGDDLLITIPIKGKEKSKKRTSFQQAVGKLRKDLTAMLNDEETCDVVFTFYSNPSSKTKDSTVLYAHKAWLSARSSYFRALFFGKLKETSTDDQGRTTILIPNSSASTFGTVLRYLYSGQVSLRPSTLGSLVSLAPLLCLNDLVDILAEAFQQKEFVDYFKKNFRSTSLSFCWFCFLYAVFGLFSFFVFDSLPTVR